MLSLLWPVAALAQAPAPPSATSGLAALPTTSAADTDEIARVRHGLSLKEPVMLTGAPRFHADAESGLITEFFQVPDAPFSGGGPDIVGLIKMGLAKWRAARQDAEIREVRAQIERELIAIHGGPPPPPEGLLLPPRLSPWTLQRPKVPGGP